MASFLYSILFQFRLNKTVRLISSDNKSILDIGCRSLSLYNRLNKNFSVTPADINPKSEVIDKQDILNLSYPDNSFDCVICLQTLEHLVDPGKALKELKRVAKKQIIISVPKEPMFTLFRGFCWHKEHLWAITPAILKHYLGQPEKEKLLFFHRYYLASWLIK